MVMHSTKLQELRDWGFEKSVALAKWIREGKKREYYFILNALQDSLKI